jgi:hypothetical protein
MSHPTYTNDISSNKVSPRPVKIAVDPTTGAIATQGSSALAIPAYDRFDVTYVAAGNGAGEIKTITYYKDGSVVGTVTFTYNADDKVTSAVLS